MHRIPTADPHYAKNTNGGSLATLALHRIPTGASVIKEQRSGIDGTEIKQLRNVEEEPEILGTSIHQQCSTTIKLQRVARCAVRVDKY